MKNIIIPSHLLPKDYSGYRPLIKPKLTVFERIRITLALALLVGLIAMSAAYFELWLSVQGL